tara:strand:+ start:162 stop:1106 length:945 start_codon:yes stop_codon:yes gene_type:complete
MTTIIEENKFYELEHYKYLENSNIIQELNQEIILKINKIAKRVGAPSYQKTPVFKRNHYKKQIKKENISAEDWETIRNFKKTKLEKNIEGIDAHIDKIRSSLNKLTDKTYDSMLDDIKCVMKEIDKNDTQSFEKIGKAIFEIGSFNKFWCKLYVRLYKDLIEEFPFMKRICLTNFESFMSFFTKINYIDANEDYNLFCEYNKENEKRRALSNFFILCATYKIIEQDKMINIIKQFINDVKEKIKDENQINYIEELIQNISIMIISGKEFLVNSEQFKSIIDDITFISKMNHKLYPSLTNKIIFKCMDLLDEIED